MRRKKRNSTSSHLPSRRDVVLAELPVIAEQGEAVRDRRQALRNVVAQGIDRLKRVRLRLVEAKGAEAFCKETRDAGEGGVGGTSDVSSEASW